MLWLVGAGTGDPDLLTGRGIELVRHATILLADRSLWPLVRAVGAAVAPQPVGDAASWPAAHAGDVVVLCAGDAIASSAGHRAVLDRLGRPYQVLAGVAVEASRVAEELLGERRASLRPLAGRTVVVTRPAAQQEALAAPLRRLGATVVGAAPIAITPPSDGGAALAAVVDELPSYDWVVLTSANGAHALLDAVGDLRSLGGVRLAAIGPATAAVLAGARLVADLVPKAFVAEGLLEAFPPVPRPGARVALVRAEVARDTLPDGLRAAGWAVEVAAAYRTVPAPLPADVRDEVRRADAVLFSSPSTVHHLVERLGLDPFVAPPPAGVAAIAIGPVTAAAIVELGLPVAAVAQRYDGAGLLDAVCTWAASAGRVSGAR